jgi:TolB-like protein
VAADQYFTDGSYDDLLTQPQRIAGLRVISRTSVEVYRGSDKTIPDIGRELGVDYSGHACPQRRRNARCSHERRPLPGRVQ